MQAVVTAACKTSHNIHCGLTYEQLVASSHKWAAPLHRLSQQEEAAKSRFCLITIKQSNNHPWEEEGDEEEEDEEGDEVKEGNEE